MIGAAKRIITSYRSSGTPVHQICKKYGVSRTVLYRVLREAEIPLRNKPYCPRPLTPAVRQRRARNEAIIQDRRSGMTGRSVAKKYDLSEVRIGQIMRGD